jgi:hypothetical protein
MKKKVSSIHALHSVFQKQKCSQASPVTSDKNFTIQQFSQIINLWIPKRRPHL